VVFAILVLWQVSCHNQAEDKLMPRAIWTGSLSFGLVNIPIEVHTAVRDHRPHFRMLHSTDRSPINFERICQKEGKSVAWGDIVKGYEYEKGRFVVLSKEDFDSAALEKTRRIDVLDFVESDAIDDRYFDKPYYLTAKKGGEVAYALLREAMSESGRIGIAKFIMRETQHLAAVEGIGDALVLSTLRFADELVDTKSLSFPSGKNLKKSELTLAKTLVENLAAEWDPEKYKDDYQENLMRVIKAKMKGKEAKLVSDERPRDANVIDLMERLRQSLGQSGTGRAKKTTRSTSRKPVVRARKQRRKGHAAA
jgi:DNA end-binding protein Ku